LTAAAARRAGAGLLASVMCLSVAPARAQAADEVPFITTPDAVTTAMLEAAGTGPQDFVIDLGSGDGRIVITAAKRHGARGLGVEIVPSLVEQSRRAAASAGVADRVRFEAQDLFATGLGAATVVTMYLLPQVNLRLRSRLFALAPGTRIVSHDWDLGDWAPDRTWVIPVPDKAVGREKASRVHLWKVPVKVQGRWCAAGAVMDVQQHFARFAAEVRADPAVASAPPVAVFDGRVSVEGLAADGMAAEDAGAPRFGLEASGRLRLVTAGGVLVPWVGREFTRTAPGAVACPPGASR
jgi:SAM-dependent methyltransferase